MVRFLRRRWGLLLTSSSICCLAILAFWIFFKPFSSSINRTTFDKISIGMTREEVEGFLVENRTRVAFGPGNGEYYHCTYSDDDDVGFPPTDWIVVRFSCAQNRVLEKEYGAPDSGYIRDRLVTRIKAAIGRYSQKLWIAG
jgi:hypothetical protein